MYMKHSKVLIEPIAAKRDKKKAHAEREEERDPDVEMMERRRWIKEIKKLAMRWFVQNNPTRRGYQKRIICIWREIGTFEITEQRLTDQV